MAVASVPTKMNRMDFINLISEHCHPEVENEEVSRKVISDCIARFSLIQGKPIRDTSSFTRKQLILYLSEKTSPKMFHYDFEPSSILDEYTLTNKSGWYYSLGRSGTLRTIYTYPSFSSEYLILARDAGICCPSDYKALGFSKPFPTYPSLSDNEQIVRTIETMAFSSLPIRHSLDFIKSIIPRPMIIHPECNEHYRKSTIDHLGITEFIVEV